MQLSGTPTIPTAISNTNNTGLIVGLVVTLVLMILVLLVVILLVLLLLKRRTMLKGTRVTGTSGMDDLNNPNYEAGKHTQSHINNQNTSLLVVFVTKEFVCIWCYDQYLHKL